MPPTDLLPEPVSTLPSNWGRWGTDDQLGTLHFITDAVRARAVAAATTGRVVSLAREMSPAPLGGPMPFGDKPMPAAVQQVLSTMGPMQHAVTDVLVINVHHAHMTHIDALVHVPADGHVYPGKPLGQAVAFGAVHHGSTAAFAAGITTRGVFLDLAPDGRLPEGHRVSAADLEAAEARVGVRVESGDALVVRGGWRVADSFREPLPAMSLEAVARMADREVSLFAGDIGDQPPFPPGSVLPMHQIALAQLGMPLIDNAEVDELAATCLELGRASFLLVVAPMRLAGATGLPVNPLAVF